MLLAIVLSFVSSLYAVARPYCVELARVPGSTVWWPPGRGEQSEHVPGVVVFAPAAPLTFTNAQYISDQIMTAIARSSTPVKLLVIEASGMIAIDYTGSQVLQQTITRLKSGSIDVAIARLADEGAMVEAEQTGLLAVLAPGRVFKSVEEAVRQIGPSAKGRAL
jgi:sulfate permease, SulP family